MKVEDSTQSSHHVHFVYDLPDEAADGVETALYADDTKLYQNVSCTEHCDLMQVTLSNMHDWSQRMNNIRFKH